MIIFRYLLKEVAKTQLAVFLVIMTIFISNKFVRVLDDASEGGIPGHLVMTFIGLKIPDLAGMILPLSFFLGVLLAYGRIYAENEMTVLHACGVSEWYVVRVTLILGFVTAIITGIFTLYLSPMAAEYEYQVKDQIAADSGLSSLIAGRFQTTGNKKAVVFIHDKNRADNTFEKVFVAQLPDEKTPNASVIDSSLVYAATGQVVEEETGLQRLILSAGTRYQNDIKNKEFRQVAFDKYYIQIQDQKVAHKRRKLSAIPTSELYQDQTPETSAESQWRIAFPLACIIMTLVAVPLSVVNPRQGKFGKMLPALLLFLSYFLLLTAVRSGIEKGSVPQYIGLWPVHFVVLVLGFSLLVKGRTSGRKFKAKIAINKGAA
ncbi:LPS export ABC transporter permease LptF [Cognaticolwellia beringensis]|uniref:Lipopolysaccharide export system permease protein LptF n=1 Tax=Cognaticolwellia beringensis TaxID=1967665 RepID=A0A222G3P7_9GAMM|nr:LPS export ABC transporter permease LptF [Cognaticolwellia beringensis]ASP46429.1 LPS export ABC transporter permease LptF [Cognaticolwellia beringensis]